MIKSFYDLEIYKKSKTLFLDLAEITKDFPKEGQYLKSQLLRAANSVHSNIAEGYGRSEAEFKQYLTRALGSNNEILSHLEDISNLKYIEKEFSKKLIDDYTVLGKQIFRLRENWKKFS